MTNFNVVVPHANDATARDFAQLGSASMHFNFHTFAAVTPEPGIPGGFLQLLGSTRKAIRDAVHTAIENKPDGLIIATSAETFWGGVAGNAEFESRLSELTDINITTGASACDAALIELQATKIALLTPYPVNAERETRTFFDEAGYEVVRVHDLRCRDAASIAAITHDQLTEAMKQLGGDDIDAVVQVGTNLNVVPHLEALEAAVGVPIFAINAASLWHAARSAGVSDQLATTGRLLSTR